MRGALAHVRFAHGAHCIRSRSSLHSLTELIAFAHGAHCIRSRSSLHSLTELIAFAHGALLLVAWCRACCVFIAIGMTPFAISGLKIFGLLPICF